MASPAGRLPGPWVTRVRSLTVEKVDSINRPRRPGSSWASGVLSIAVDAAEVVLEAEEDQLRAKGSAITQAA
jgi:hypothetical protein